MHLYLNLEGEPNELVQFFKGFFEPAQIGEEKSAFEKNPRHLSQSHPEHDICDTRAGEYPNGIIWGGWHPKRDLIKEFESKIESQDPPQPEVKDESTTTAEPKAEAEQKAEEPKKEDTISDEDLRVAMRKVRNRIEYGEPAPGDEKGSNEEADASLHRELNGIFKAEAKRLGAEKPTALPQDKRQEFINTINNLRLNTDGTITPF